MSPGRRRLAWVLLAVCIWLGAEQALRAWGPPPERLEAILEIFELHPTRIWTLRKGLGTRFEGAPLHTDSEGWRVDPRSLRADSHPIHVLGDSLTFGWGVGDSQAWPARLQGSLGMAVRNASVPGYTTWQGGRVLDEVTLPERPRVVMLCHGVNDVSKLRFFGSDTRPDAERTPQEPFLVASWNLLMRTRTYRFLRNRAFRARDGSTEGQAAFLRLSEEAPPRVSLEAYRQNLEGMVARTRRAGAVPVLVKMPLNLPLPPEISPAERERAANLFAEASRWLERGRASQAASALLEGLRSDPLDRERCWQAYELGRQLEDSALIREALARLQRMEVYQTSARHVESNRVLDRVAAATGTPVLDVEALFGRFPGTPLFNDPVRDPYHPNPAGHALIAEEAARFLRGILDEESPGSSEPGAR